MLYTSYISKLKDLPDNIPKILITRFAPRWLNINQYSNLFLRKELSPSQELLLKYKKDSDWEYYVKAFNNEIETRNDMKNKLEQMLPYLKKGKDMILICYEKDYTHCHRSLLAHWFEQQGIEWKEWSK